MSQEGSVGPLDESVGYTLKQAASALRAAMDDALRPLGLSVSQYACLEVLGQRPGLSHAELARAVFVSRQAANLVLRGLQERGLLARPGSAAAGRARPTDLTPAGREVLSAADAVVGAVQRRMIAPVPVERRAALLADLRGCVDGLARSGDVVDP